jgi:hypothetical protein
MRNLLGALKPKNPHTAIITGVKSALRNGDAETIKHTLSRFGPRIGLPTPLTKDLTHIITSRLHNTLTHHDATHHLTTIATQHPTTTLPPDTWLTLENIARTIGCFHASHHFTRHAITHLTTHPHPPEKQFLAHLHTRNLTAATHTYTTHHTNTPFWLDAGHYLWHWSSHTTGTPHHTQDPTWTRLLTGHHITILGPAPTTHTPPPPTTPHHTARVIVPGVMAWGADSGPFGSACDLAYANSRSTKWFIDNTPPDAFAEYKAASFRTDRWRDLGIDNGRTAANHSRLLLLPTDKTNMVPLMVWDVLSVPDVTVTIAGTTFFATPTAYTADNLRFSHSERGTSDQRGSTGELFERCRSFSHHALTQHLSFMANLVEAGAVSIDADGAEVVGLSAPEYLNRLDELYGVGRL